MKKIFAHVISYCVMVLLTTNMVHAQCQVHAGNDQTICAGQSVNLNSTVTGGTPTSWKWMTGGSVIANTQNTTVSPATTTVYIDSAIGNGCASADTIVITVNQPPATPAFTFTSNNACSGATMNFSVTSPLGGITYTWNFNNGNGATGTNVTHQFHTHGGANTTFNVVLTATDANGCTATTTQVIGVHQKPDAEIADYTSLTPFTSCGAGNFVLTIDNISTTTATNTNYYIDWGDGSSPLNTATLPSTGTTHTYTQQGFMTLTLTVTGSNGCTETNTYTVFNGANPAVGLGNPGGTVSLCIPTSLTFPITGTASNPPGTTYTVTTNDGSPPVSYNHPPPASFTHTFNQTSCGATGANTPNSFYVRIQASNPCGFSQSTIEPITTSIKPIASFTASPNPACMNSTVTFTNTSIPAVLVNNFGVCDTTTPKNWLITPATGWTLVSGSFGNSPPTQNPATWGTKVLGISFQQQGSYTVTLIERSSCGNDTVSHVVCIQSPPVPSFTAVPTVACAPFVVAPNNTSIDTNVCGGVTYLWTVVKTSSTCTADSAQDYAFINGTNASSFSPQIRFNNQGIYTIKLSATNVCGTFVTPTQTITVKTKPQTTVSVTSPICVNQSVSPSQSSLPCAGTISGYSWSFPGGSPSSSTAASPGAITYSTPGVQNISLVVTNECGNTTATASLNVLAPPAANAGPDQLTCSGTGVQIGSAPVGGLTYSWSPTTGLSSSTVSNPTATLTNNGSVPVIQPYIVTVANAACSAKDTMNLTVNPLVTVNAGPDVTVCAGSGVALSGSITGGATTGTWTAPSGTFLDSSQLNTTYYPSIPSGTVTVTLTSIDPAGPCPAAADALIVTVNVLPVANAGPDQTICTGGSVVIGSAAVAGTTYSWTPATGLSSTTVANPTFTRTNVGTTPVSYTFIVTATKNACQARDTVVVTVNPMPTVNAGPDMGLCAAGSITLAGSIGGAATLATWSAPSGAFGNTGVLNTSYTPSIGSGTVTLTLTTDDPVGPCPAAADQMVVTVYTIPVANAGPDVQTCSATGVLIGTTAVGGVTYAWSPAGGLSSTTIARPTVTITNPSDTIQYFTYSLITTANGCSNYDTVVVAIYPKPVVDPGLSQSVCKGGTITLAGNFFSPASSATWSSPSGTFGNASSMTSTFTPTITSGTAVVTLTSDDPVGPCPATSATVNITVFALPATNAGPDVQLCNQVIPVNLTGTPAGGTWSGPFISSGGVFTPGATGAFNEYYTYTDANSCTNIDSAVVTVIAPPNPSAGPDDTVCLNHPPVTLVGAPGGGTWSGSPLVTSGGTFTASSIGTYNLLYTVGSGTCLKSDTMVMLINPLPTTAVTPTNPSICAGDTVMLTASGASTFAWSPSTGLDTTSGAVVYANPANTITYTVTGTSGSNGCANSASVNITVKPRPVITNNPLTATVCSGSATATFVPTANIASTFDWTATATTNVVTGFTTTGTGNIPGATFTLTDSLQGFVTYHITPTANACPGTPADYVVTVNPVPFITLPAPQTICSGDTFNSVVIQTNFAGTNVTWTAVGTAGLTGFSSNGTGDILSTTINNSASTAGTITYNITATSNGCSSTATYAITVNPRPVVTFSSPDQNICSGTTSTAVNITSTTPNVTITWTANIPAGITGAAASGGTSIPAQTLVNNTFQPLTVVYTAIASTNGVVCAGPPANYQITVRPLPDLSITPRIDTLCSSGQTNITLSSQVANTTFSWTFTADPDIVGAQANSGVVIQQTLQNIGTITEQVVYHISTSAQGCPGATDSAIVKINPIPATSFAPVTQSICNNTSTQQVQLTSTTPGATFTWTASAPGFITGYATTGDSIIPAEVLSNSSSQPGTVTIAATATFDGCGGGVTNYSIIVYPTPTVTNPGAVTICAGDVTPNYLPTSNVTGTTFAWTGNATPNIANFTASGAGNIPPQTINMADSVAGAVTYTVTPTANGCPGPTANYIINVNPVPVITLPPVQTKCNGDTSDPVVIHTNVANTVVTWNAAGAPGVSGFSVSGTGDIPAQIITNTATTPQNVIYAITASVSGCTSQSNYVITVNPKPVLVFSGPDQTICSGNNSAPITISSTSPNVDISWTANIPAGITGAQASGTNTIPTQQLSNSTLVPLTVIYNAVAVTYGVACPGTPAQYQITVNPGADVIINPPFDTICSSASTNITLSSTAAGATYAWTVSNNPFVTGGTNGNGNTIQQTLQNSANAPQSITYTIQATLGNCPGQTATAVVTVNSPPVTNFTPGNQNVCNGQVSQQVQLSSPASSAVFSWTANGDPFVSGYTVSGTGDIPSQLLVNNSTQTGTITIAASANANGCVGPINNYIITVQPTPHIINTDTVQTICSGSPTLAVQLQSDVTGATFNWSASAPPDLSGYSSSGTGDIPSQTIVSTGSTELSVTFAVNVTANGCPGPPVDVTIGVNPIPVISVNPPSQVLCTGGNASPIVITSSVANTSYSWTGFAVNVSGYIPNGVTSVIPAQVLTNTSSVSDTGYVTYTISPTVGACPGVAVNAAITVLSKPVVDFTVAPNSGCSPLLSTFSADASTFGYPTLLVYDWGDSTPTTVLHPNATQPTWSDVQHTFINSTQQPITYTIKLTAVNSCGDTTVTHTVTVQPNGTHAAFTPSTTQGCEPLTVNFADNSTGGTFVSWCFNYNIALDSCFGPSSVVAPGTTVQNTFTAGDYLIALYIADGCSSDTAFQPIHVTAAPLVDFTFTDNVCAGSPVSFTEQATPIPGSFLTAFNWQFGTGDSSTQGNPVYVYDTMGIYNACLTVTADNGCTANACHPVTITQRPVVNFVYTDTCLNKQPIAFTNTSTGVTFYQWDFGDGNTDASVSPSHTYAGAGTFYVKLIGSTNVCADTIVQPVVIHPLPTASFTAPAVIPCGAPAFIPFTNTSTDAVGYSWDFGNNTTSTDVNPTGNYALAGPYDVTLIAINQFHCYDTFTAPILVPPYPVINSIDVTPAEGCRPLPVTFKANTTDATSFTWDFGDGSSPVTFDSAVTTYTYLNAGTYTVKLTVFSVSTCGDTVTLSDTVKVHILPTADFTYTINTTIEPVDGTVEFTNRSQNAVRYVWDFGDGLFGFEENPVHRYAEAADYSATLVAISQYNCTDTITKTFTIFQKSLFVPNAFAPEFSTGSDLVRVWQPIGMGLRDYHAQIFNTWGELLWESTLLTPDFHPAEGWDGTYQGKLCQQDVYVWKVEATFVDGTRWKGMAYTASQVKKTIGSVTLIR